MVKKWGGGSLLFQRVDCLISTRKDYLRLGANILADPISPLVSLSSNLVAKVFQELINSSSLDCLIDLSFVTTHKLPFWIIDPLPLVLIDGTISQNVNQVVTLPIQFTCGYFCTTKIYIMHLDGSSPVVLEYNWLRTHNPDIDWREEALNIPPRSSPIC